MKKKRVIIITGSASGIGKALLESYQKDKDLFVIGIDKPGTKAEIPIDLSLPFDIVTLLHAKYPDVLDLGIDTLINCAGLMPFVEGRYVFDVNFWGTYEMMTQCFSLMDAESCVINIASTCGIKPDADLPIYSASKAAVISITQAFAKRWAQFGVRVNCISPGFYKTNLVPEETPQALLDTVPLGFEEEPEALFAVVETIRKTRYMTGSNITIDGGLIL